MIKLVVGLGNPGEEYAKSRHNAGRFVLSGLATKLGGEFRSWKGHQVATTTQGVALFEGASFMNLSGQPVAEYLRFHDNIEPEQMLIIHDELDLPFGRIQVKYGGSDGGHNGVKSVIQELGTADFWRLRIGIGRPTNPSADISGYVLSAFTQEEQADLEKIIDTTGTLLVDWLPNNLVATSQTIISGPLEA